MLGEIVYTSTELETAIPMPQPRYLTKSKFMLAMECMTIFLPGDAGSRMRSLLLRYANSTTLASVMIYEEGKVEILP